MQGMNPLVLTASLLVISVVAFLVVIELQNVRSLYSLRAGSRNPRKGVADLLVYANLVAPGIILNKDGALMAGWRIRGEDATSKSAAELAQRIAYINQAFIQRDVGWMFHYDKIRVPAKPALEQAYFRTPTERVLDEARRASAERDGARFESRDVLVVTYLPPTDLQARAGNWLFTNRKVRDYDIEPAIAAFEQGLTQIEDALRPISLELRRLTAQRVVDERGSRYVRDELLEHLNFCINGVQEPINTPEPPLALNEFLATRDLFGGFAPRIGEKHVRTLTISGFPH